MNPFTGTDRFAIRRRLGSGSSGVVFEAFDHERQIPVALKVPHDAENRDLARFREEFRTLAELSHPNLAGLYEVMTHESGWFYTMELVEGTTILEELAPGLQPCQDFQRVRAMARQLAQGLRALHQAGTLHRDLKPSHVRVDRAGRVVLLDYGFTDPPGLRPPAFRPGGASDGRTQDGRAPESHAYLAPERIGGHASTEAADWYSFGVILYQVLTGTLPFPGDTLAALIDKMRVSPSPPDLLAPQTPTDLSSLCMELLDRQRSARPAGARILERLGAAVVPAPPRLPPPRRLRTSSLLIGRKAELGVLGRAFETALKGRTTVVFVHGPSGMGKSYLLRRFVRRLGREEQGTVVLAGRCGEEGSAPYQALDNLMENLAEHLDRLPAAKAAILMPRDLLCLARLFPVLKPVAARAPQAGLAAPPPDPQELRRRAFAALRELLMRMGTRHPLALILEDLQWGDPDSAALLSNLLRVPDPPAMLVVLGTAPARARPPFRSGPSSAAWPRKAPR